MLRVEHLHIRAGGFMLRDITFTVGTGDYFVLLGASGVGKTLLLEALAGLIPVTSGRIHWEDEELTAIPIQGRGLGLVYQNQALFPHMTVWRNIAYGLQSAGVSGAELRGRVHTLAGEAGVTELLERYPETLSGGEAQRVALARALATGPRCLLLDEPLSALDNHARGAMRALLRRLHRNGQTVIHVTHDYAEALALATCVGIMETGTIVQTGTPAQVFQHPTSEFVARFVGIRNVFAGALTTRAAGNDDTTTFISNGVHFQILTDAAPGPGIMMLRSEDITLAQQVSESSAQNSFRGRITDIIPGRIGLEVYVDIGVEMAALVSSASATRLGLKPGHEVWLSFKASAVRFLEE